MVSLLDKTYIEQYQRECADKDRQEIARLRALLAAAEKEAERFADYAIRWEERLRWIYVSTIKPPMDFKDWIDGIDKARTTGI